MNSPFVSPSVFAHLLLLGLSVSGGSVVFSGCVGAESDEDAVIVEDAGSDTGEEGDAAAGADVFVSTGGCRNDDCPPSGPRYCTPNGRCAECTSDAHCGEGTCLTDRNPSRCSCAAIGDSCLNGKQCCSGSCGAGICKEEVCRPTGEDCTMSSECCGKLLCNNDGKCERCGERGDCCGSVGCCRRLTCHGRGRSGDGQRYKLKREGEDIAAVVDSFEQPATLVGHSFGGLCALEAASMTDNLQTLVLYGPVVNASGGPLIPEEGVEALEVYVDRGEPEKALDYFLDEIAGMPASLIEGFRQSPLWAAALEAIHTAPREVRAINDYRFEPERLQQLKTPTVLIRGGESPEYLQRAVGALSEALPNSRVVTLAGQGHGAIYEAPKDFADVVLGIEA